MRALLTLLCRLLLRIFFRRVRVVGRELVPSDPHAPVLYVLNHPNALLDPLFIVCLSPRPVTFLVKAPLFDTFMVKRFVRAFDCLPVYRKQDGADPKQNRASIEASIALLSRGKALALFPEGISHSGPSLAPLKTGAARIALSASAVTDSRSPAPVLIVPVGLDYADKTTFRSDATLIYGPPIETPIVELDARERPPLDAAEALTARIREALVSVTLQAQTRAAVELARAAARVLGASNDDALTRLNLEQRLIEGYEALQSRYPGRVRALARRILAFEAELAALGLRVDEAELPSPLRALRWSLRRLGRLALLAPFALVGVVTHWLPYRVVDYLAHRLAPAQTQDGDVEDVLASLKLSGGLLLFPLTWLALALIVGFASRWTFGLAALALVPACGYAALRALELLDDTLDRARAGWRLFTHRALPEAIAQERAAIRAELVSLAEALAPLG